MIEYRTGRNVYKYSVVNKNSNVKEEQLKTENKQLKAENEKLKAENENLKQELLKLKVEMSISEAKQDAELVAMR